MAMILTLPARPGRALRRVLHLPRLLHGAVVRAARAPPAAAAAVALGRRRPARARRGRRTVARPCGRGLLRRAGRRRGLYRDVAGAAGLGRAPPDPRRRRHVVSLPPTAGAGSAWTSTAATCRSTRSPSICSTRSWRSRITASTRHPGVDPIALGRAVVKNVRAPGTVQGGSTLTQQLARTLFLSNKRTYGRKVREAALALMIDGQLSKEQVLELYLNRIYLSAGVYGVETMSRHLFGRPAKQLNLAECALIAGLARAPSTLSPWSNLDGGTRAQPRRLDQDARGGLHHRGAGAGGATDEHPHPAVSRHERSARRLRQGVPASGVPRAVRRRPSAGLGGAHDVCADAAGCRRAGRAQRARAVQRARAPGGARRDRSAHGQHPGPRRRARLRASRSSTARSRSRRQPGSAFKPLLFAAALENGYSPVSLIEGLTTIAPQGPDEWAPQERERRDA